MFLLLHLEWLKNHRRLTSLSRLRASDWTMFDQLYDNNRALSWSRVPMFVYVWHSFLSRLLLLLLLFVLLMVRLWLYDLVRHWVFLPPPQ
jgi:hypothetical protein